MCCHVPCSNYGYSQNCPFEKDQDGGRGVVFLFVKSDMIIVWHFEPLFDWNISEQSVCFLIVCVFHLFQVSDIEFVEGFVKSGFVGSSWNTSAPAEKKDWVWWIWCATCYDDNDNGNESWWWRSFTNWQGYESVFQFFNLTIESIHGTPERNANVLRLTRCTDICKV